MRLTKIVTKKGDTGKTTLGSGEKVSKDDLRIHVLGELDELNSLLGWVRVGLGDHPQVPVIKRIQNHIFDLGAQISMLGSDSEVISEDRVIVLDTEITALNRNLPPLEEFIIPGGSEPGARIHIARSVCRRVERSMITLAGSTAEIKKIIPYINRLSDYLFILSRSINISRQIPEDQWSR